MDEYAFKALGTQWSIVVDGKVFPSDSRKKLRAEIEHFESRFSRFKSNSEVSRFRDASAGSYDISRDLATLLLRCAELRSHTHGAYDPAVGELMELKGYDTLYTLKEKVAEVEKFKLPTWDIAGQTLTISGSIVFDLGGTGKGFCIDMVARWLVEHGYPHVLVDGGGDLYATTKANGSPWVTAIQYPGSEDLVAGTLQLSHSALAVSDSLRRRWGSHHHIVNPYTKESVSTCVGVAVYARNAWDADCATSGLFLTSAEEHKIILEKYTAESLVFFENATCKISAHWPGKVFTKEDIPTTATS